MKLFHKIAVTTLGIAMATAAGAGIIHHNRSDVRMAKADGGVMLFDFEDSTAHRTSGSNSFSENTYTENGVDINLNKGDSITTGTPLSGTANICIRIAKDKVVSGDMIIGPIDFSNYNISGYSYDVKSVSSLTVTSFHSVDGTNWTQDQTYVGSSTKSTKTVENLTINGQSNFYIKIAVTITNETATSSNRDTQLDNVSIVGVSTSTIDLDSISCNNQTIDVAEQVNLNSCVSFNPTNATNKNLSFNIKSGSSFVDLNQGIVTGKKGGAAVVTITPDDDNADPIDVSININSLAVPSVTIDNEYAIYAIDSKNSVNAELTGVSSNLGTSSTFEGNVPPCSHVFAIKEGYFENTVAFEHSSNYLALTAAGNSLHTKNAIDAQSSWIVSWDSTTEEAVIKNAAFPNRSIQFNYNGGTNSRFACYALENQVAVLLHEYSASALTDFQIDSELSIYKSGTGTIHVTYTPADAADKTLNWSSDDETIATVDDNGVVTGVKVGETTVRASKMINSVNVERTCTVSVLNNQAEHAGSEADPFNISDAVQVAKGIFTKNSAGADINLANEYYVKGMVTAAVARTKTKITVWLGDTAEQINASTGGFEVYQAGKVSGSSLSDFYNGQEDKDVVSDFTIGGHILVKSILMEYNGTAETKNGAADIVWGDYIEARGFAEIFISRFEAICENDTGLSDVEALSTAWGTSSGEYSHIDSLSQAVLTEAQAKTTSSATDIQKCVAKYDYIAIKYNTQLSADYDFMGRNPQDPGSGSISTSVFETIGNNTIYVVIVTASIATISLVGFFLVLRKRKEQ